MTSRLSREMSPVAVARFWGKVDKEAGPVHPTLGRCWIWSRFKTRAGYGRTNVSGKSWLTHRLAYELVKGPIPAGLTIDHLCRVCSCCNPAHLEPVTNYVNRMRGTGWAAQQVRREYCPHGHPYSEANTTLYYSARQAGPSRICNTCKLSMSIAIGIERLEQSTHDPDDFRCFDTRSEHPWTIAARRSFSKKTARDSRKLARLSRVSP